MKDVVDGGVVPTKGIWLRFLVLIPLAVVLVFVCRAYIRSVGSTYVAYTPIWSEHDYRSVQLSDVSYSEPGVVEVVGLEHLSGGNVRITLRALTDGETEVSLGVDDPDDTWLIDVRDGCILDGGVDFSGWESIHISICIFLAVTSALFASVVIQLKRACWYGYEMVASGGGMVFSLFQLVLFLILFLRGSVNAFSEMAWLLTDMAGMFVMLSLLPMGVLALLVSLSNVWLIRHEGRRPINLLGVGVSAFWALANFFWLGFRDSSYQYLDNIVAFEFVDSLIAVGITFGECLLLSTIACAWLASRHVPKHGADYLVILGCGIRPDGTPSPLLAARVDRAFDFDAERVANGDQPAVFVPSGGQGPDEVMSEAQSMCDYLVGKGVAPERVVLEGRSTTTRENMLYSKEVIEGHAGCDASQVAVAFSTTNYHVFRGYVCAHQAGMAVEGMASKTKMYFWPNAFLREFIGLLATQWKGILQTYLILAVVYALAEYILFLS